MHNITDTNKLDKMSETARTVSRTGQKSAHTAMDYALGAQEINTEILRRTSQAWIEGFRYQARFSQGMAQVFLGQWGNAFKSMPPLERLGQEQSGPVGIEPATNGAQKVTEPAAKDVQKDIEKAEKVAKEKQKVAKEKQKAEKVAREKKATEVAAKDAQKKAEKKAETQQAEKVAKDTRKAEKSAEETQKKTEIAAESAQKSAEPDAEETQKGTEIAAKDAQKNTETAAFPVEGYDEMNVGEVSERLDGLSEAELKRVGKYEEDNKDRGSLRKEMNQKIETTS